MTPAQKRIYNQQHYAKNRDKTLEKAKVRYQKKSDKIVSLFSGSSGGGAGCPPRQNQTLTKGEGCSRIGSCLIGLLVATNTIYLVHEAAQFYAMTEPGTLLSYVKAILLEGAVLALTLISDPSRWMRVLQRSLAILIYAYTIWVVSGSVLHTGFTQLNQLSSDKQIAAELESEIFRKTSARESLFSRDRITLAGRMDQQISDLQKRLDEIRARILKTPSEKLIWNSLLALVGFRVLVMAGNLMLLGGLTVRSKAIIP